MKQVGDITIKELRQMSGKMFGDFVKAVVDIEKKLVVVDAEMHYDEEQFLLERGSKQANLWGINLYPSVFGKQEFIEYDSMINIRPNHGNPSRDVESTGVRQKIEEIIAGVVHE